ncbi:MAG: hypothetical protein KF784_09100 [Fimbriimonadaceae bacterium]|nr:hypothetical protein [Fimbriimonadaceae bacterium]
MPELPDITIYVEALGERIVGQPLERLRIFSPSLLKTVSPSSKDLEGQWVTGVERLGKKIVVSFHSGSLLVLHLMISGRLLWFDTPPKSFRPGGKSTLAVVEFPSSHLLLTEVSTHHRASLWILKSREELPALDPGGIEPLECSLDEFRHALTRENRTLKRALTNPKAFSGIGNAYSDEILHAARLSPVRLTHALKDPEIETLYKATQETLVHWTDVLRRQFKGKFPGKGKITAFRPDFAAHGKYGKPCPVCGKPIQRIRYAENETNYCAVCQNEGRLLADRSLSRLLKDDWPKTVEGLVGEG